MQKPRRLAGAQVQWERLHLRLASVSRGIPHAASLIAIGLCLSRGYVRSKS
jgi:hypothetical protein